MSVLAAKMTVSARLRWPVKGARVLRIALGRLKEVAAGYCDLQTIFPMLRVCHSGWP